MHNSNNGRFDALSERSLLGMLGARERCRRSPSTRVQVLRQIVDLYNRVIHPSDPDDAVDAARSLLRLLRDVGYHDAGYKERAERVLAEAFPSRELEAVVRMARTVSGQASGDDRQSDDVTGSAHASAALIRQLQARSPGVAKPPADLADLIALNATGAQLAGVDLCGARLFDADLSGAQLAGANLSDTVLFGADLSDTILAGADLCGALLAGADLSDTVLAGADLSGAQLAGADLTDTVLVGADLCGARLHGADLSGAQLAGADLTDTVLAGADLCGARLHGADLSGAQLAGADLTDTVLAGADLSGAQLDRAALVDARLDGANLTSAALVDARLDGASLIGAQLDRANLEGAQWSTGTRWPDSGWARRMWDASEEVSAGVFQVRPDPGWERADFPPFV